MVPCCDSYFDTVHWGREDVGAGTGVADHIASTVRRQRTRDNCVQIVLF